MSYVGHELDLVYIDTDQFTLIIKGKPIHPDIQQPYPSNKSVTAKLTVLPLSANVEVFKYYSPNKGLVEVNDLEPDVYPCFFEQQNYLLFIDGKANQKISFYHENKNIRESISTYPGKDHQLMGIINFRNDVGLSEFEIRVNGQTALIVTVEVFPSKIEYRRDYFRLLNEVNNEIYNLAYDFLRSTFQTTTLREASSVSLVEFFSIIRLIFDDFIKAYNRIEMYPHHELNQTPRVLPVSRVKKTNNQSIRWLSKNPQHYHKDLNFPEKLLNIARRITVDTFENRFVKWIITQLLVKLRTFEKRYQAWTANSLDTEVSRTIAKMTGDLSFILKNSFLKEVGSISKAHSISLVLQMGAGYREIYKNYLMLSKGLSVNSGIFRLSMKQIWELYEYWCFLELNNILRKKYQLVKHDLIDVNYQGLFVTLKKGGSSKIEYQHPRTGERFTLSYNSTEGEQFTTAQKPDHILTLKKEGSQVEYKFIFDAKYRINPALPGSNYYNTYGGIPGPEEETINTMHRYRDAIVKSYQEKPERVVVGAFVLFPYHDEDKFQEHHFYKSIEKVNVGAFPFLPGSTCLVSEFLESIIDESHLRNYERHVLPAGDDDYRRELSFQLNVLVGTLRGKDQFKYVFNHNLYYIPYQKSILNHKLEYVALYQSEKSFGKNCGIWYYSKIQEMAITKRKKIELPTRSDPEMDYIVFHVDQWEPLDRAIKPEGYGISGSHIYTNILLLEKASTLPELSIKTLDEWRTWLELKRVQPEIRVLLDNKDLENATGTQGFALNGMTLTIEDACITIRKGETNVTVTVKEFFHNLRGVLKQLSVEN